MTADHGPCGTDYSYEVLSTAPRTLKVWPKLHNLSPGKTSPIEKPSCPRTSYLSFAESEEQNWHSLFHTLQNRLHTPMTLGTHASLLPYLFITMLVAIVNQRIVSFILTCRWQQSKILWALQDGSRNRASNLAFGSGSGGDARLREGGARQAVLSGP